MSKGRILIVDDDRLSVARLDKILSRGGFRTASAEDGEQALAALTEDREGFDCLLLDRQMPRMGGIQLLQHLQASERFHRVPVIFETAMDRMEDIIEGLKAGAYYYLTKPLEPKMVLAVVTVAVEDHWRQRSIYEEMERTRTATTTMEEGVFRLQTLQACHELSSLLAGACPDSNRVAIGLSELLINALEHGNLGITFEEKSVLMETHRWQEEVEQRQSRPKNLAKWIQVRFSRMPDRIRFEIQDEGSGFQWRRYLEIDPELLFQTHGRGILMAKMSAFDRLEYLGCGNRVVAEVYLGSAS